ncbi:MAG: hypothetical protein Ct9H300mP16_10550 [Pseudomonadota bacterium]|nr:MAG: hypothetical protein Ct9H300mP16_10550 [Pseudomonadota bacterium]
MGLIWGAPGRVYWIDGFQTNGVQSWPEEALGRRVALWGLGPLTAQPAVQTGDLLRVMQYRPLASFCVCKNVGLVGFPFRSSTNCAEQSVCFFQRGQSVADLAAIGLHGVGLCLYAIGFNDVFQDHHDFPGRSAVQVGTATLFGCGRGRKASASVTGAKLVGMMMPSASLAQPFSVSILEELVRPTRSLGLTFWRFISRAHRRS